MSRTERVSSGVRLPLFLLLGFLLVIAGVVIWLTLTAPPPMDDKVAAATEGSVAAPAEDIAKPPAGETMAADPPAAEEPPKAPAATPAPAREAVPVPRAVPVPEAQPSPEPASDTASEPAPETASEPAAASAQPAPAADAASPAQPDASATPAPPKPVAEEKKPAPAAGISSPRPRAADAGVQISRLPPVRSDPPLSPAPAPDLIQETPLGPLPQTGTNGRAPWKVYAKPFNTADPRPRVAIVVTGLGLSAAATESAIQGLPGSVTLAFAPYATGLNDWIRLARAAGHEVLLNVPMEPVNYPAYDPGPQTLLTSLNAQGNLDRLMWILSRGTGYVGIVDFMGSRFTASKPHLSPVLAALNQRGLLYLDSASATRSAAAAAAGDTRIPWAAATLTLDERASRVEIDKKFALLEKTARSEKRAIGIASPYPVTLERIATWSRQLVARGIAVAPVSAMVAAEKPAAGTP